LLIGEEAAKRTGAIMELGWVDFSEEDRRRVLNVLEYFENEGAVDELGIGVIRDRLSDYFFPGTSTLHTKAKYFFVVPYILKELEGDSERDYKVLRKKMDRLERSCAEKMIDYVNQHGGDPRGIIGNRSLPKSWVARTPAVVYWAALQRYGFIRNIPGRVSIGITECLKMLANTSASDTDSLGITDEESEKGAGDDRQYRTSLLNIPLDAYRTWLSDQGNIVLSANEAVFLEEKIIERCPGTMLSFILESSKRQVFLQDMGAGFTEFSSSGSFHELPETIREAYGAARAFSEFIYGLRIRYNIRLQEKQDYLDKWRDYETESLPIALELDIDRLWRILKVRNNGRDNRTKQFLKNAYGFLTRRDINSLDKLIVEREKSLKGQARVKIDHPDRFKDLWYGGERLEYRFAITRSLIDEIVSAEVNA
jgi:hypothetical protein